MDYLASLLRFFHIGSAILWIGAAAAVTLFVAPAAQKAGPAGGQVMANLLLRTKYMTFMPVVAILTTLAGLALYGYLGYFRGDMGSARLAMLNIGVAAGMLAFLHGLGAITPLANKMKKLAGDMAARQGPPAQEQVQSMQAMGGKLTRLSHIFLVLSGVAVFAMTTFRYL